MSVSRTLVTLSVVLAVVWGLHHYLWVRLVRDPGWPRPWRRVGTVASFTLAASIPLAFLGGRLLPRALATPLAWAGYTWMGVMFLVVVLLLPSELVRLGAKLVASERVDLRRRGLLGRSLALFAGAGGVGLGAFAMFTALRPLQVKRVRVPIVGLSERLRGFSIVQLTDIHVGPTIDGALIEEIVAKTNACSPDVIAITGDLVDGSVAELGAFVEPLRKLRARHGVYFVTGNHEYYSGVSEWIAFLEGLGIRVLGNERVSIEHEGEPLDIAGVHDWSSRGLGHGPDLERALSGLVPGRKVILLAHQPKQITEAAARGVSLQLSGHTHGGQIFPFNYLVHLQQPFVVGLHRVGDTALYVSPGAAYWGPPMRLGTEAEISQLVLE